MTSFDNQVKTSNGWKEVEDVKVKASTGWKTVEDILVKAEDGWHSIKQVPKTVEITATAGSNGTISPQGTSTVIKGESITYTITPSTGYRISSILVDGVSVSISSTYTFTNVQENHTISVSFTIITFTVTLSPGSYGTITGDTTVNYGSSHTYYINPNTGYNVSSVTVDGVSQGAVSSVTLNNITSAHTISATFTIQTFTITTSAGTGGSISPSGSVSVNYGSSKTFTISPSSGYAVNAVTVDGVSKGAITSFTFSDVTSNHTISATFKSTIDTGVYTISWTESSTSKNISWSGDAAGMTEAQRLAKIKEHSHFAVVKWDGTKRMPIVNYWLYDDDLNYRATDETGKTSSGVASNLTGTDGDVMMLYETVFWKVTTSGSGTSRQITISFTWDKSKKDSTWVSPHCYGDSLSATNYAKYVGLGVFEGYVQSSQLRSINTSSQPTASTTQNNFYNAAIYNRNWQYNNQLPMTYAWYVMQLYFVKGNRDVQTAYGNGIVGASAKQAVNLNWSATNAWNNGTTANQTTGVTALGIQNAWGNVSKFMGETRYDNYVYRFTTLGGKDHNNIDSGYASTWNSITVPDASGNITAINGSTEYPFFPNNAGGTTYSAYYGDSGYQSNLTDRCVYVGGSYTSKLSAGALRIYANPTTSTFGDVGARLHVLITE